jgi:hypothetical protein
MSESIDDIADNQALDPYIYLRLFEIGNVYEIGGENILGATFPLSGRILINEQVNVSDRIEILEHEVNHLERDRAWYSRFTEEQIRQITKNNREMRGIPSTYHTTNYKVAVPHSIY